MCLLNYPSQANLRTRASTLSHMLMPHTRVLTLTWALGYNFTLNCKELPKHVTRELIRCVCVCV